MSDAKSAIHNARPCKAECGGELWSGECRIECNDGVSELLSTESTIGSLDTGQSGGED